MKPGTSHGDGYFSDLAAARGPTERPLTPREREVCAYLSHGLAYGDIAELLGISPHTVRHHTRSARAKLGAKNTAHLMAKLIRRGLI